MNILQVSCYDSIGGAARIAQSLHLAYRDRGKNAWMAVGRKIGGDAHTCEVPESSSPYWLGRVFEGMSRMVLHQNLVSRKKQVAALLKKIGGFHHEWHDLRGIEDYEYPATWNLLDIPDAPPDIVHAHNLHEKYFDLRYLSVLSNHVPTLITMHDMWLLTGHCAHSLDCQRWKTGCGICPYLEVPPPVKRDATAYNWSRKKEIYARSRLYIATPSRWLMQKVNESPIFHPLQNRVIPNGVDLSIFHPMDREQARKKLQLHSDIFILLFVAVGSTKNVFKDYSTIQKALEKISSHWTGRKILAIALGGESEPPRSSGNMELINMPYIHDQRMLASYYRASDVYLHAARADTFPNVILEALACGTPVIATAVGGIPEQIKDAQTGFITPEASPECMAARIVQLLESEELRRQMGLNAAKAAMSEFSLDGMVENYLAYYQEILEDWRPLGGG